MEALSMLKTVIFPNGCLIDRDLQILLAMDLVPKLEKAGMTMPEWTRGAEFLEEPHLTKVKSVVCRGCVLTSCTHNSEYSPPPA